MTTTRQPGHYVREARIRVFGEHSQERAAAAADISQPYLSQIERGERRLTGTMAIKMERGWELERDELVRWSTAMADNLAASPDRGNPGWLDRLAVITETATRTAELLAFPPPRTIAPV